jgi:flavin reductase (DIM6/NTAB) family NADH-FMN oxidoreductase RutF
MTRAASVIPAELGVGPEAFRRAMSSIATPVSIVTALGDRPHGTTVSTFASLSLDPPMVLVAPD